MSKNQNKNKDKTPKEKLDQEDAQFTKQASDVLNELGQSEQPPVKPPEAAPGPPIEQPPPGPEGQQQMVQDRQEAGLEEDAPGRSSRSRLT